MEGGDTWYYDTQTAVHSMFGVNATGDGQGTLGTVVGQAGTFTEGMTFTYQVIITGSIILKLLDQQIAIFNNQSPSYGTGVANDASTYKTIAASHEFGGFDDGASTKAELMAKYLSSLDLIIRFQQYLLVMEQKFVKMI